MTAIRPVMKGSYVNLNEEARQVEELTNDKALHDRNQVRQLELQEGYKNLLEKHKRGEIVTEELMAFRLHMGTLQDTRESRVEEVRKEWQVEKKMRDALRSQDTLGESPQEFLASVRRKAKEAEQIKIQAIKEVGLPTTKPKPSKEDKILAMQKRMKSSFDNPKFDSPYMKGVQFN